MFKENRLQFAIFFLIFLISSWLILDRVIPEFHVFAIKYTQWPDFLILIGGTIFIFGLLLGSRDMFIPAVVIAGFGGILSYQYTYIGFASWSYMWTLIPGFVGAGMIVSGLFGDETSHDVRHGLMLIGASALLFIILGEIFGGLNLFGNYMKWTLA